MISQTLQYKGYRIKIEHDEDCENPLIDSDMSALVKTDCNTLTEYNGGIDIPTLTRLQIKEHAADICQLLEYPSLLALARSYKDGNGAWNIVDIVNSAIDQHCMYDDSPRSRLYQLETLLPIAGINHIKVSGHGYVQRDWHEILITVDDSAGYTNPREALRHKADVYESWAYGDCYGYVIDKPVKCDCCGHVEHEDVSSCWGFIGKPGSEDYNEIISEAKSIIDNLSTTL